MRKKIYYSESLKLFWKNKLAVLSLLMLVILSVSAILAPALTPYDPNKQVLADKLLFPSAEHLFGTDEFGRDILTRCLYGCRVSLSVGLISQLIASVIGTDIGALLTGSMITENVFNIPGIGKLLIDAIHRRDIPLVQGGVIYVAAICVLIYFIVDILYAVINPNIRLTKGE